MKLKMYEIIDLPTILSKLKRQKLPFKTAYKIVLFTQEVQKHVDFYQETFRNLLTEYGKKDEQGNLVPTSDGQGVLLVEETMSEAYQKLGELRDLEVELPDSKFSVDDFDGIEISPEEMMIIMPFIEA
jgi:hypothetical protein